MAPEIGAIDTWCFALCPKLVSSWPRTMSSYFRGLSLCFLPKMNLILHISEIRVEIKLGGLRCLPTPRYNAPVLIKACPGPILAIGVVEIVNANKQNQGRFAWLHIALVVAGFAGYGRAQHFESFSFNGQDGYAPQGALVVDSSGNFYGGTGGGGDFNGGVIFKINSTAEETLYNFGGSDGDGIGANGDLVFDTSGNLYGTTVSGGGCPTNDCGIVFELSPPASPNAAWTETVLHSFGGAPDGSRPAAGLVFDGEGNVYGTTEYGGSARCGCGTVFELMPPQIGGTWTESILYSFTGGPDGSRPLSQLVSDQVGNLYGTTYQGGNNEGGTIFELSPPQMPGGAWTKSVLYRFGPAGGRSPAAGLTWGTEDALFGTTSQGGTNRGGTVFRLASSGQGTWSYSVVYSFSEVDGFPFAPVTFGGPRLLFGTTANFGDGTGSIFQISYSEGKVVENVLYNPGGPAGGIVLYRNALYGTTAAGAGTGDGTVYRLSR